MSRQGDFHWPEKVLEKMWEIDNKPRISKEAEMKRKFNRNQKCITFREQCRIKQCPVVGCCLGLQFYFEI